MYFSIKIQLNYVCPIFFFNSNQTNFDMKNKNYGYKPDLNNMNNVR